MARDGDVIDLVDGRARLAGHVPAELVYVDGQTIGRATEGVLAERRQLKDGGVVTVLAILDPETNALAEPPEYLTRGFVSDGGLLKGATAEVTKALAGTASTDDIGRLESVIAGAVARHLGRALRREPVVIAVVVDA